MVWNLLVLFESRQTTRFLPCPFLVFQAKGTHLPDEPNFRGHSFWARGYYVSTVGLDEARVRKYIQNQEENESIEDQYYGNLSDPFQGGR